MRGAVAISTLVVVACSQSYGDSSAAPADGGTDTAPADETPIDISPTEIDFGSIECGASAAPRIVLLRNRSKTSSHYRLELPQGAPFEVQGPLEGELAADAITAVNVIAKPNAVGENLSNIIVSAGSSIVQIPLKAAGDGGRLAIAPTVADVGSVRYQNGGTVEVALVNTGTKPFTLLGIDSTLGDVSAAWEGSPNALTLAPNVEHKVTVKLAAGLEGPPLTADLTARLDGPHCGAPPVLPVKGQRVSIEVTVSPADFGKQSCNSSPTLTRDVVIANYTANALAYTATLSNAMTAFKIVSGGSDSIPAGSSTTPSTKKISLGLKPLGAKLGAVNETVDVEITGIAAPSGGKRTATATADVRGVVLNLAPTSLGPFLLYGAKPFSMTNAGNESASLSYTFQREASSTQKPAWVLQIETTIGAGVTANGTVRFTPVYGDHGSYSGDYTFGVSGATLCNTAPKLHVAGNY